MGAMKTGNIAKPDSPVGLFAPWEFRKALKIQINVSDTTTNRAFVHNKLSLSQ